ncbi:hypothetical protein BDV93DRAFT_517371 [Ceratobasidium sp. AG-I]|nr:hypothetical protein BDV93DRAFT_517371 [Ceratobasidium sp. AG-I]
MNLAARLILIYVTCGVGKVVFEYWVLANPAGVAARLCFLSKVKSPRNHAQQALIDATELRPTAALNNIAKRLNTTASSDG